MTESNVAAGKARANDANSGQRQINVTLVTADECEGKFTVTRAAGGKLASSRIVWSPHEPDRQTETMVVTVGEGEREEGHVFDGDTWRELESQELDDELWERVLSGESLEDALANMRIQSSGPRM